MARAANLPEERRETQGISHVVTSDHNMGDKAEKLGRYSQTPLATLASPDYGPRRFSRLPRVDSGPVAQW